MFINPGEEWREEKRARFVIILFIANLLYLQPDIFLLKRVNYKVGIKRAVVP